MTIVETPNYLCYVPNFEVFPKLETEKTIQIQYRGEICIFYKLKPSTNPTPQFIASLITQQNMAAEKGWGERKHCRFDPREEAKLRKLIAEAEN